MHQHYQNKLTQQQEQISIIILTEDRKFYNNTQHLLIKKNYKCHISTLAGVTLIRKERCFYRGSFLLIQAFCCRFDF